jgi:hypothetical protein
VLIAIYYTITQQLLCDCFIICIIIILKGAPVSLLTPFDVPGVRCSISTTLTNHDTDETLIKQSSPWFLREAGKRIQYTVHKHHHAPKTQPPMKLLQYIKYQPVPKAKSMYEDAQRQWIKSQVITTYTTTTAQSIRTTMLQCRVHTTAAVSEYTP